MKTLLAVVLSVVLSLGSFPCAAQLLGVTGANHPELEWKEYQTEHFTLVFHQGLDSTARMAAPIAEEVYRVVTTNLETAIPYKIRIYLSDNDEERNAFTFGDHYIFIWMRGILDDNLFSLRASGTSKWLRSVITHEFTHFVIARATHTFLDDIFPGLDMGVPRWFNEGMARYMEPDGWTDDLDVPLRVAAVSSKLHLGPEDYLSGTLLYEGGQSLVRYIAATYGDSALTDIICYREPAGGYDFKEAVKAATHHTLDEIYTEWHKILNVYYNTEFGQKEDIEDIARKIPTDLAIVGAARIAPDGKRIAILGKRTIEEPTKLFLLRKDSASEAKLITGEPGIEPDLCWTPDGKYLIFSKIRFGEHGNLVFDLFRCNVKNGDLERISSDERLEYPDVAPNGTIVAAQFLRSGSDLVLLNADGTNLRKLTHFEDDNVQVYAPRFSPDGKEIAFSIFRKNGMRDVATIELATGEIKYLTNDSINDRYPIWSPHGDSILFLSFQNNTPNLYAMTSTGMGSRAELRQQTDVASNVLAWDWSKNKDSILVTSFTGRNSVQLFWIGANRSVASAPAVPLSKKYTAWRGVRWPLVTRPADSLPPAIVTGPYDYNSLAHIRPLLFFPIVGTDVDPLGNIGTQWGAFSVLSDEMQKHLFEPFAWYGTASGKLSYGFVYENNQLLPTITVGAQNVIEFKDVIQDIAYYQHTVSYDLGLDLVKHTPNSIEDLHNVFLGASYENLQPWNESQFDSIPQNKQPIAAKLLELGGLYTYFSPLVQMGVSGEHADQKLGSDFTRTRMRAFLNKEFALDENELDQLAFLLHGAADYGAEIPQDFLGFYKYDAFEQGFNLATIHERDRLRGIRRYYYGNRLLLGSFEIREADRLFTEFLPLLEPFQPQLVEFFDMGTTWYANAPTNNPSVPITSLRGTQWLKTAGVELRSGIGVEASIEGGVGWELVKNSSADWFIRITSSF
jgi:hypothetical protein